MTTVTFGFDLLDSNFTAEEHLVQVGSRLYRLLPYAIEHWIDHLFLYASSGGILDPDHSLPQHLSDLRCRHNQILGDENEPARSVETSSDEQQGENLQLLTHLSIHDLVRKVIQVRLRLSREGGCESGQGKPLLKIYNEVKSSH